MSTRIRSLLFSSFFFIWTAIASIMFLPLSYMGYRASAVAAKIWSYVIILALRLICGITYREEGKENIPEGNFIIAAKHQSAWETIIFLYLLPSPVYVLKKELKAIPLFGNYLTGLKMVAVDRSGGAKALKSMLEGVKERLLEGRPVIIFPEGTRTPYGQTVKYHPGIASVYQDTDVDFKVVPVALDSGRLWGRNSLLKKPGVITVKYLPPIEKGLHRKEFMKKLSDEIEAGCREIDEKR